MNVWSVLKSRLTSKRVNLLQKQNKILMDGLLRPVSRKGYFSQSPFLYPTFPFDRFFLYDLSYSSDTLTTIHNALRRELFRNGYELAKAKDTQEEQPTSEEETIPKGKTTEEILEFLESINENQQCLLDVCMETEDDFSVMDNAFWVFMFEYIFEDDGTLKSRELKQLLRADPRFMGPILNKYDRPAYNDDDIPLYFCPEHRESLLEGIDTCHCGKKCWQAFFFKFYEGKKVFYSRWEVLFRSKYRPTIRGGFPPVLSCYDDRTEVLTENGWKYFYELNETEKIATFNKETENIEYQKPTAYQIFPYTGRMYRINTNKIDLLVTPDHNLLVKKDNGGYKEKFEFVEPKQIEDKKFKFYKNGKWEGKQTDDFVLPSIIKHYKKLFCGEEGKRKEIEKICPEINIKMEDWLEFMGYFLSEGSVNLNKGYTIKIAQSKEIYPKNYEKIEKCLKRLPFKYTAYDEYFVIYNNQLGGYLKQFGKCRDKFIPKELLNLPSKQLKILFDALMLGDGCYSSKSYATTSKKLADNFQELCLKVGYSADIFKRKDIFILSIRNFGSRDTSNTTINKFRKDDYWEDYNGLVYDLTVPNHTLYVRRNGKVCWSGNCWQKTRTLLFMDKYIMQMYDGQRPPKHGLFFKTANPDSLYKTLEEAKQKIRDDPHWPLMMAIPDATNGQEFVKFIDFMKSMDELQHVEMRNEFRRQIGAVYGVEPVFQGDISTSGGLNNEGLQVTVTNRSVEYGQNIYNNHFFPELLKAMGVQGFTLKLNPSEEQDEMAKLTRQNQSLFNGQLALQLGLKATYDKDTGEVIIEDGKLEEKEQVPESQFGTPTTPPRPTGAPSIGKGRLYQNYEFNKELMKARSRPPFTKFSNIIKREIDKFIKRFKRKPSEVELSKAIGKINLELTKELKETTSSLFKRAYIDEIGKVEGELGVNVLFGTIDENALSVLNNQEVLSKAYTGIASNLTNELNGIIQEAYRDPKGLTSKQITDKIKDLTDVADFHAETIARTESSKVSAAARKNSYSKEEGFDTFLFKWIGPDDNRTTETSKRIKSRAREGVSWSELIKIVEEESSIDFPEWTVNKDFPVSHYQSRHTFVKIPGSVTKKEELTKREEMQEIEDKKLKQEKKDTDEELNFELKKNEVKLLHKKEKLIESLQNE